MPTQSRRSDGSYQKTYPGRYTGVSKDSAYREAPDYKSGADDFCFPMPKAKKQEEIPLSEEQQHFVDEALLGKNILVDACIGSGKTTAIQRLCDAFPEEKNICYLTYSTLLKLDAKDRITNKNAHVTNYHGYAYEALKKAKINSGRSDQISKFLKYAPKTSPIDVLILDEYQDIDTEISLLLKEIKRRNPDMQIVAVGDMDQKIFDRTTLNPAEFIREFLGDFEELTFTKCFRLSREYASMFSRIWEKPIEGVNDACRVRYMSPVGAAYYLKGEDPGDILCLGSTYGQIVQLQNVLERECPQKFNKYTVYSKANERTYGTRPVPGTAIFTTFDSSKGMERPIVVVFDFTEEYWDRRASKADTKINILRNIFCVAASRGKKEIIFVTEDGAGRGEPALSEESLRKKYAEKSAQANKTLPDLFSYIYKEDVDACYAMLDVKEIPQEDHSEIEARTRDGLIDLGPCIELYQKVEFFKFYSIDMAIEEYLAMHGSIPDWKVKKKATLKNNGEKVLYLASLTTGQDRYATQVDLPLADEKTDLQIKERLSLVFKGDESAQKPVGYTFTDAKKNKDGEHESFDVTGTVDVIEGDAAYLLCFREALVPEDYLECACGAVFSECEKGVIWNTRNNEMYEVRVPDKDAFLKKAKFAVTKHMYK